MEKSHDAVPAVYEDRTANAGPGHTGVRHSGRPGKKKGGADPVKPAEIGGRSGPEPTRYGDWEKDGRCIDF